MLELRVGRKRTGYLVVEDGQHPGMYRVRHPDGELSDMANLSRAKDACLRFAMPKGLGGGEQAYWHRRQTRAEAVLVDLIVRTVPTQPINGPTNHAGQQHKETVQ